MLEEANKVLLLKIFETIQYKLIANIRNAMVTSGLDYCNTFCVGLPFHLQLVQNAAA